MSGIQSGEITATIVPQPYLIGYESILLLARIVRDDKGGVPASGRIVIPTLGISRSNVNAYLKHQKRLLNAY